MSDQVEMSMIRTCVECVHWDPDVPGGCLKPEVGDRFDHLVKEMVETGKADQLDARLCTGFQLDEENEVSSDE